MEALQLRCEFYTDEWVASVRSGRYVHDGLVATGSSPETAIVKLADALIKYIDRRRDVPPEA